MTDQFVGANKMMPITPPPELVQQWHNEAMKGFRDNGIYAQDIATQAARWGADQQLDLDAEQINQAWQKGADQELEACCEWLEDADLDDSQKVSWVNLRAARRPNPPSLKEQALESLRFLGGNSRDVDTIRRALEQLDD